tara:strand:- start:35 stop:760 length:726 start_codon:yes stop_codon:yes gene_type:complete
MKLSVITIVLNDPEGLKQTLESLNIISDINLESIVINGGNDKKTIEVIEDYRHLISKIVNEEDYGVYDAMNKGIKLASGDVISFLNAGDVALSNYSKDILSTISDNDYIYSGVNLISNNGKILKKIPKKLSNITEYLQRMPFSHPGLAVKSHCFKRIGHFNLKKTLTADHQWIVRLIDSDLKGIRGEFININFYLGGASMSIMSSFEMFQTAKDSGRSIIKCYIMLFYSISVYFYYRIFNR